MYKHAINTALLWLCVFTLTLNTQAQITNRIYTIGNSVTDGINFAGFRDIANQKGNSHIWGRHMIPGSPLSLLWDNRNTASGFTEAPFGLPANAFTNYTWDVITLQPFDRSIEGTSGDLQMSLNYMDLAKNASPNVQFYIYSRYPRKPSNKDASLLNATDWNNLWNGTYGTGSQSNETKKFFEDLVLAIRHANTTTGPNMAKKVLMIPVGDVMHRLNQKITLGRLTGYNSIWDVYSDGIHMNSVGQFILGSTFFATTYKQDPRGINVPSAYGSIPNAIRDTILQTVYEIVFAHPFSGTSFADIVPPTGVMVTPKNITLGFLQSATLQAQVLPANAGNKRVSWFSSNTAVATVDSKGKVIGRGSGVTTITGRTNEGGFTDFAVATVTGPANFTSVSGTLLSWDFRNVNGLSTILSNFVLNGVQTTTADRMASLGSGLRRTTSYSHGLMATEQTTATLATSIAADEYMYFTVAPMPNKLLNINQIRLNPYTQNVARKFALFSSVKGFQPENVIQIITGTSGAFDDNRTVTITGHTNLTEQVEFRLYVYNDVSTTPNQFEGVGIGNNNNAPNDIEIYGDVITLIDNEKPTSVTGITASQIKDTGFQLSWNESTDNMIVLGYNVYINGLRQNSTLIEETNYAVTGLTEGITANITITAVDFVGNESVPATTTVITNRRPTAVLNASVYSGIVPLTVDFNSTGSSDPDTDAGDFVLGFDWNFGNGQISSANSGIVTYTAPGIYTVSLRVVDTRDLRSNFVFASITVSSDVIAPTAPTHLQILGRFTNHLVISIAGATDNIGVSYYSLTANGTVFSNITQFPFTVSGLQAGEEISLKTRAHDAAGNYSTILQTISITKFHPEAFATASRINGTVPLLVNFSKGSTYDPDGDPLSYTWKIDSSIVSTAENFSYAFSTAGVYLVSLKVTDDFGGVSMATITITALPAATVPSPPVTPTATKTYLELHAPYPNPTESILYLDGVHAYEVFNVMGEQVMSSTTPVNTVDLSALPSGIYFLQLNQQYRYKILKK